MAEMLEGDLVGFDVETPDGTMGRITDMDRDFLTVKPGFLRKRHMIPCQVVTSVDRPHHRVRVKMTKHQIADAPSPLEADRIVDRQEADRIVDRQSAAMERRREKDMFSGGF